MKSQSFVLGSLLVSAFVLTVLLILTPQTPKAQGEMTLVGSDYQIMTAAAAFGGDEAIHVIDRDGRMLSYRFQISGPAKGDFKAFAYFNVGKQ